VELSGRVWKIAAVVYFRKYPKCFWRNWGKSRKSQIGDSSHVPP